MRLGDQTPLNQKGGNRFQFQLGAIGRVNYEVNSTRQPVSIPAWCDWERRRSGTPIFTPYVSIPAWCDWETIFVKSITTTRRSFNSSLVRLGGGGRSNRSAQPRWFQFQLGAIGRLRYVKPVDSCLGFNSSLVRLGVLCKKGQRYVKYLFQFQLGAIGRRGRMYRA